MSFHRKAFLVWLALVISVGASAMVGAHLDPVPDGAKGDAMGGKHRAHDVSAIPRFGTAGRQHRDAVEERLLKYRAFPGRFRFDQGALNGYFALAAISKPFEAGVKPLDVFPFFFGQIESGL
jgi:hypothetical protein